MATIIIFIFHTFNISQPVTLMVKNHSPPLTPIPPPQTALFLYDNEGFETRPIYLKISDYLYSFYKDLSYVEVIKKRFLFIISQNSCECCIILWKTKLSYRKKLTIGYLR